MPETRFGAFVQAWSTHGGKGRVIAWGDSTIFSNFCLYQPGKAQVLLNLVEWLNHQGGTGRVVAVDLVGAGGGRQRTVAGPQRRSGLAGARGGRGLRLDARLDGYGGPFGPGNAAARALEGRRLPLVTIDRTTSQAPLEHGPYNDDPSGAGFGSLEMSLPRLGCQTARAEGENVFRGDAVVMIYPNRPIDEGFRKRLIEYVNGGGRVLVIDAGLGNVASTANQVLRPFGVSLDYTDPWNGDLAKPVPRAEAGNPGTSLVEEATIPPGIHVDSAWPVLGGTSVIAVHGKLEKADPKAADVYADRTICAVARYGTGLVLVASFGNMFNDGNLGKDPWHDPTPAQRAHYDVLFAPPATPAVGRADRRSR